MLHKFEFRKSITEMFPNIDAICVSDIQHKARMWLIDNLDPHTYKLSFLPIKPTNAIEYIMFENAEDVIAFKLKFGL